jgi:hypothetical protein
LIDLYNIKNYTTPRPNGGSIFGSLADYDALPETHKAQILFLDKAAEKYIYEFIDLARLPSNGGWAPFENGNFKTVEQYSHVVDLQENIPLLKKWLYSRGIPFRNWVFVLSDSNEQPLMMTWKMLIKYAFDLFLIGDTMVFDQTINWCLFNYHEGQLHFAKDAVYDTSTDEFYMQYLNERKKKFPQFKHPYL